MQPAAIHTGLRRFRRGIQRIAALQQTNGSLVLPLAHKFSAHFRGPSGFVPIRVRHTTSKGSMGFPVVDAARLLLLLAAISGCMTTMFYKIGPNVDPLIDPDIDPDNLQRLQCVDC
jgi:hypothetical protein